MNALQSTGEFKMLCQDDETNHVWWVVDMRLVRLRRGFELAVKHRNEIARQRISLAMQDQRDRHPCPYCGSVAIAALERAK